MSLPPELIVTVEKVNDDPQDDQYLAVTRRSNGAEVCRNTFRFHPDLLVHLESQWMLDKAVPRYAGEAIKRGLADAARLADEEKKLADYGRQLYGLLFGDGEKLRGFLEYNDAYRSQARLTLALHPNAAGLWRLPWEYLHDERDFLALTGRLLLSRVPHGLGMLYPATATPPLRILVVVSAPDDQRPLDTEEEIGAIQRALDEAVRESRVEVKYQEEATLPAIGEALRRFKPHVLHYTGHGFYDRDRAASFLALEDDAGCTRPAGIADLRPLLHADPDLRLALLSGCQTAQTSDVDAFAGVATGLLAENVPAVLAMQYSILDQSGITLAAAFYAALAEGAGPIEAAQRVRIALWQDREGPGYDWGVPALYLRAPEMRLVAGKGDRPVAPTRGLLIDVGGLPLPPYFVGRKPELRALRHALCDPAVTAAYVRGIGGMGKSSVAAKFLERPGVELDAPLLVIRCNETAPLDIPVKLARWLEARGEAGHAEAAALILDSRQPPADRTRQAMSLIADRRYVFVFDNFESVMAPNPPTLLRQAQDRLFPAREGGDPTPLSSQERGTGGEVTLAGFFAGLLAARWRGLCLFTGRYRWDALEEHIGRGTAIELALNALTRAQAVMLMDNLPRLHREPMATKLAVYRKVGGHPKSIELLEGWLASGRIANLLADPNLDGMLAEQWADYFLAALLAQLGDAEREALARLCIFETALDQEAFGYAEVKPEWVRRWLDLSLAQREGGAPERVTVHSVVREYLTGRMTKDERRRAHEWAAAFYGRTFVEMARRIAGSSKLEAGGWTEDQIEALARDLDGAVGRMVTRTDDLAQARGAMTRALAWHRHLFAAGEYEITHEIVTAVIPVLHRWGERDRAKALLNGSIATLKSAEKAVAQSNLATLLIDEGKLADALATYEEAYWTFEALGAKPQMAAVLNQQSIVYDRMGRFDDAIALGERGLVLKREPGDEMRQAISLHQLSIIHEHKEDYTAALALNAEAEKLARKVRNEALVATTLHAQGLIYNQLARAAATGDEAATHCAVAVERFETSLAIKRRIGNQAGAADTLGELGKLWRDAGQMREAIDAFTEALGIDQRLGRPAHLALDLEFLGSIHERQGQYAAALEKYQQALELARRYSSPQHQAIVETHIARVQGKMGAG